MGEKTGWTYLVVSKQQAEKIKPGNKKTFRVKGKLDEHPIKSVALLPRGDGSFIMAVNATMRKAIRKIHGAELVVQLEEDKAPVKLSAQLLECLKDDPDAEKNFNSLPTSHKNWYSNWVNAAKGEQTKAKRIATIMKTLALGMGFSEMMKEYRGQNLKI